MQKEHKRQQTDYGIIDYYTYRKEEDEIHYFSSDELRTLLSELIHRKHMIVRSIFYTFYDDWGYVKEYSTRRKSDIEEICGGSNTIDGLFTDGVKKYIFKYRSAKNIVMIIECPREMDINFVSSLIEGWLERNKTPSLIRRWLEESEIGDSFELVGDDSDDDGVNKSHVDVNEE